MTTEIALPKVNLTQLLKEWSNGNQLALEQIVPLVSAELHRVAAHYLRHQPSGHLLQPTALVNEVWLHLIDWSTMTWQNRAHFFGVAAQIMRRILVDEARKRKAQRHGGNAIRVTLSTAEGRAWQKSPELVALDDALNALARLDAHASRIVELRFFGGLSVEETAEVLQVSPRKLARDWRLAQAWLYKELTAERGDE